MVSRDKYAQLMRLRLILIQNIISLSLANICMICNIHHSSCNGFFPWLLRGYEPFWHYFVSSSLEWQIMGYQFVKIYLWALIHIFNFGAVPVLSGLWLAPGGWFFNKFFIVQAGTHQACGRIIYEMHQFFPIFPRNLIQGYQIMFSMKTVPNQSLVLSTEH